MNPKIYQFTNPKALMQSNSPLGLTPFGEGISLALEANKTFEKYAEKLVAEVEKMSPDNAYDIQKCSLEVARSKLLSMVEEKELAKIKQEAFDRGILAEDILNIFGLLLRNHVLNKKGIPLAEVDKFGRRLGGS